jgi:hypothetical protein
MGICHTRGKGKLFPVKEDVLNTCPSFSIDRTHSLYNFLLKDRYF